MIPVIGFAAYSGTGKTTVMEKVIAELTARGLRVGTVKHDGHGFEIDRPGRDSFRHAQAGAKTVVLTSPERTAEISRRAETLNDCLRRIRDVDVILVEGFKEADIPQIGLCRKATGKGFTAPVERFRAVVTDVEGTYPVPRFDFEDTAGLADWIMKELPKMENADFTHFDDAGRARMVNVGDKEITHRVAVAAGRVLVNQTTFGLIRTGGMKKGDVLTVAQIAGIMAAKRTPDLIPMCHPVSVSGIDLRLHLDEARCSVEIEATVRCDGRTGVEMEALTAVSGAALTVYDMCKAVQRDMVISDIRLVSKTGGVHGDYVRKEQEHV